MENKILVVLEQRNNQIKKSSLEAITVAKDFSEKLNGNFEAVLVGGEISDFSQLGKYGLKKITHFTNPELNFYSSNNFAKTISDFVRNNSFNKIILSNTSLGKDLAPRIAIRNDAGIVVDVTEYIFENGELIYTRPIFAGKVMVETRITKEIQVVSLRANVFKANESYNENVEVVTIPVNEIDNSVKTIELKQAGGKIDVAEADIIVSGGRGMKAAENFNLIENLAEVLGAATGASRAVVDAGWRPHSEQVGQTGKTVSPNLYIAVGISGAIQHLAGMRSSKCIVAINKDKDAPIFQVADYGLVADAFEVLPVLTEEIKKMKS
jgi:electron transfer flavoprotein alpha subunit